jgi:Lrp/AsnC family transcriptional regulator, regulator for asnA, asnC and gidA
VAELARAAPAITAVEPRRGNGFIFQVSGRQPIRLPNADSVAIIKGVSSSVAYEGSAPAGLDAMSRAIIEQLQADGRRPYAKIAAAVGLSEAAVRQRVSRLIETGVVQIVAVTNPLQLGFTRQAMIGIKAEGNLDSVVERLNSMDEVDYVVVTAGSFDILAEVVCEDDDHLLDLLNHEIRVIPGVRSTESFVYLKLSKQTYQWGTR